MTADVVMARSPDSVVASPYVGRKNGSIVMMKMPKPKPVVRCTKLAPMLSRNMAITTLLIICLFHAEIANYVIITNTIYFYLHFSNVYGCKIMDCFPIFQTFSGKYVILESTFIIQRQGLGISVVHVIRHKFTVYHTIRHKSMHNIPLMQEFLQLFVILWSKPRDSAAPQQFKQA
jgi:hypothetical protein